MACKAALSHTSVSRFSSSGPSTAAGSINFFNIEPAASLSNVTSNLNPYSSCLFDTFDTGLACKNVDERICVAGLKRLVGVRLRLNTGRCKADFCEIGNCEHGIVSFTHQKLLAV